MSTKNRKIQYGNVELTDEEFKGKNVKVRVTMFVDKPVLEAYRKRANQSGDKYQSLINRTLRDALSKPELEDRVTALEQKLKKLAG